MSKPTVAKLILICPTCGGQSVYTLKDGTTTCRRCGHVAPIDKFRQPGPPCTAQQNDWREGD